MKKGLDLSEKEYEYKSLKFNCQVGTLVTLLLLMSLPFVFY